MKRPPGAIAAVLACVVGASCGLLPLPSDLVLSDAEAARLVSDARAFIESRKEPWTWRHGAQQSGLPPGLASLTLKRERYKTPLSAAVHDGHLDIDFFDGNDTRLGFRVYKAGAQLCPGDHATRYKDIYWYNLNTDLPPAQQNCP